MSEEIDSRTRTHGVPTYDHIVIGAGSASCAVAARLSEDPARRVLLVEAGGSDRRITARAPLAFSAQFHGKADWNHHTVPEPAAGGRRLHHPRGRLLGGTSAMNAMLWVRGSDVDFDGWDVPGWAWADVEPIFERIERGPMRISPAAAPDPTTSAFVQSAVATGIGPAAQLSGPELAGVGLSPVTIHDGRRWSAARAYLDSARGRSNLEVMTGTLVRRVIIEDGRAVGIDVGHRIQARGDVVLCAGAFNTPQLLQLSGVGDADHLRSVGVEPVVDNPAVGEHLGDHPAVFCNFQLAEPWLGFHDAAKIRHLARWLVTSRGKLASNGGEALAHVHSRDGLPAVDLQLIFAPGFFFDNGAASHPRPAISVGVSYWTPASRGRVRIVSNDPGAHPDILLNLLAEQEDVDALVRGVGRVREIAAQAPLRDMVTGEITPGPGNEDLEPWIRRWAQHSSHPCCSARIGPPGDGVVDPELRVHGVDALRVADASALRDVPRANTNAPSILMGERCADFIRGRSTIPVPDRRKRAGHV